MTEPYSGLNAALARTRPDAAGIEAALAAGLAAHELWPRPNRLGHLRCDCGQIIGEAGVGADVRGEIPSLHRAHVAAALLPLVTQAQAEALREAADALDENDDETYTVTCAAWLRARADESGGAR